MTAAVIGALAFLAVIAFYGARELRRLRSVENAVYAFRRGDLIEAMRLLDEQRRTQGDTPLMPASKPTPSHRQEVKQP